MIHDTFLNGEIICTQDRQITMIHFQEEKENYKILKDSGELENSIISVGLGRKMMLLIQYGGRTLIRDQ